MNEPMYAFKVMLVEVVQMAKLQLVKLEAVLDIISFAKSFN